MADLAFTYDVAQTLTANDFTRSAYNFVGWARASDEYANYALNIYQVKTGKIRNTINEGVQKLRITFTSGNCKIDKVKFICTEPTAISEITSDDDEAGISYNLSGQRVGAGYKGIVVRNGKKVFAKPLALRCFSIYTIAAWTRRRAICKTPACRWPT